MQSLLILVVLAASPASVATRKAEALTHRAIAEYNGGEFDQALIDAKKAYALRPKPELLFNLGQIHRALHHWDDAMFSYQAYLRERPDAPNRASVEDLLEQMKQKVADRSAAAAPAPPQLVEGVAPAPSSAAEPPALTQPTKPRALHIAVLDMRRHGGVSDDIAQGVTSLVVHDVRLHARGATVVGSDEIRAMVGLEHEKQLLGCTEGSCLAEIGGALGAQRLVIGSLSRFGESYVLDLKLLDSRTAKVLAEGQARFDREGALPDAVSESVRGLFTDEAVDSAARPELTQGPEAAAPRSHALAWTLFASGAVAAGFAVYGAAVEANFQGTLGQVSAKSSAATYEAALGTAWRGQANAQNWQIAAIALGAVAAAAVVTGVLTW